MVERPVIFNGEMVRAILAGRKTQTRRVMKQQPPDGWCPVNSRGVADLVARTYTKGVVDRHGCLQAGPEVYGVADETWGAVSPFGRIGDRLWVRETIGDCGVRLVYRADADDGASCQVTRWTPSIHMPRSACRLLLEITDVRVERLNDINEHDALAEGMDDGTSPAAIAAGWFEKPRRAFRRLWEKIYGQESWDSNPWVWVVEFKQVQS
ncbi:hypothetical protein ACET9K_11890 [Aeromonas enteropelogenes]|uniref:hypothetical protein n=1 Tax=Aeromonas enteropelogenes TaxID=29489 RepID=UPI0038CFE092